MRTRDPFHRKEMLAAMLDDCEREEKFWRLRRAKLMKELMAGVKKGKFNEKGKFVRGSKFRARPVEMIPLAATVEADAVPISDLGTELDSDDSDADALFGDQADPAR